MAVKIVYSDIALGAAENSTATVTSAESFSAPSVLPFGANTGAVATCEHNGWGLSSDYKSKGNQVFAFWTKEKSSADCSLTGAPSITLDFSGQYTSTGLTIRFASMMGEYCPSVTVTWYQGETVKDSGTFTADSPLLTLENTVEAFDKIVITLLSTNLPFHRAKVEYIGIGIVREYTGKELMETSFVHEIDLISDTVPVNVMDASFHSSTDTEFIFQKKQPVEAYDGNTLIGVYYIESGERTGGQNYTISCQDAIGVLDLDTYPGGVFFTDTPIDDILADIVGDSFDFDIAPELSGVALRGHITEGTKRAAIQQVVFAVGACVDTSGTSKIKVFLPSSGDSAKIPEKQTFNDGTVSTEDIVTEVLVEHYEITEETPGEKDDYIEFNDVQYKCVKGTVTARNPNTTVGMLENKVEVKGCYLINSDIAQERADAILAYYMRRNTYNVSHVVSGQELGERVTASLPWGDTVSGNIKKMTISVSGITVSNTDILTD